MDYSFVLKQDGQDTLLALKVIPRYSKNRWLGIENGELKIKIMAPPVDGAANEATLVFISELLGMAKTNLSVERGITSRHKLIKIKGLDVQKAKETLEKCYKQV
jgi:uncharacterized protein (TIGR00251 family)